MASRQPPVKDPGEAIDRAVAYLELVQRADGGFDSFSSPSASLFDKAFAYQTTFVPALILTALTNLQTPKARRLEQNLANFLKDQASPYWSFNYWTKASPERSRRPYPDDLDDTCCALIALALNQTEGLSTEVLVAFVKLLL